MQFHKEVVYPLGAGAEYVLRRGNASRMPRSAPMPLTDNLR
jgi:hypothetical protein